jgi:hypothetical protein
MPPAKCAVTPNRARSFSAVDPDGGRGEPAPVAFPRRWGRFYLGRAALTQKLVAMAGREPTSEACRIAPGINPKAASALPPGAGAVSFGQPGNTVIVDEISSVRPLCLFRGRHDLANCRIHPSSGGRIGKRRVGFDQSLLFKLGPECGRDFCLQRIVVLGDLLMASRPDDKSDRDIWRCRELKCGGA